MVQKIKIEMWMILLQMKIVNETNLEEKCIMMLQTLETMKDLQL
jgi:hypothetical protein